MPRRELINSSYSSMWLIAMFDLPVVTKKERKAAAKFRKELVKDGFSMLQYSVYGRYCASEAAAKPHRDTVVAALPPTGQVRIIAITERQFEKMENFVGKEPASIAPEEISEQLTFF